MSKKAEFTIYAVVISIVLLVCAIAGISQQAHQDWREKALASDVKVAIGGKPITLRTNGDLEDHPECTWDNHGPCTPTPTLVPSSTPVTPTATPSDWMQRTQTAVAFANTATPFAAKVQTQEAVRPTIAVMVAQGTKVPATLTMTPIPSPTKVPPTPTITPKAPAVQTAEVEVQVAKVKQDMPQTPGPTQVAMIDKSETATTETSGNIRNWVLIGGAGLLAVLAVVGFFLHADKLEGTAKAVGHVPHGIAALLGAIGQIFQAVATFFIFPMKIPGEALGIKLGHILEILWLMLIAAIVYGVLRTTP